MEMRIIKVKITMYLNHFLNNQASRVKLATMRNPIFPVCKVRTGKLDAHCAMSAIAPAGKRINQINTEEMNEAKGEKRAAIKPTIVMGATKGAANKLAIILISITWLQRWPGGDWQVANCDIGQGDSMVINLGNHRGIVIDVGPDAVAEDRCLKALGIKEIPLLILSHFHADHVAGLPGALKRRTVGQVWVSVNSAPLVESAMAGSALAGVEMIKAVRGMSSRVGPLTIKVLWPTLSATSFEEMPGDGSQINNSSIATLITSNEFSIFAGGDLEPPVQEILVKDISPVDIYKVCHHGSRYQDLAFMSALHPRISIISVGAGNTYGHPAVQTLDALTRLGSEVLRTDIDGAIAVQVRNHQFTVRKAKGRFNLIRWG